MPVYDFKCKKCNNTFDDYLQSHSDLNPICKCGSETDRKLSGFAIDMDGIVTSTPAGRAELHSNGSRIV